jgi:methionyl-tRNA formyltransferase
LRLGFAGTPGFAVSALEALVAANHRIEAVFTRPDRPAGRGRTLQPSPVKRRALELELRVFEPPSFKTEETREMLRALALDALIVVAYGLILPEAALALPKLGCFNIHASLLPRWRGAAPIQRAILAGDTVTGVSVMRMEAGLDTGPVLGERRLEISPTDTAGTLGERLALEGARLLIETLDALARGQAVATPQVEEGVTYAEKIKKSEALIDWNEDATLVLRRIRALNPAPIAETRFEGGQLRIWEAELGARDAPSGAARAPGSVERAGAGLEVTCGRGKLRLLRVQLAGRKPVTAEEFARGYDLRGARFQSP